MAVSQVVGKKHAIAYLRILIGYGFWFLLFTAVFLWLGTTTSFQVPVALALVPLALMGLTAFGGLRSWMETKRFSWTVTDEGVDIHSGWFSWQRTKFDMPFDTIFEAYYTFGLLAKMFHYGHCVIRRTEGVTSATEAKFMANPGKLVGAINQGVKEFRDRARQPQGRSRGSRR